MIGSELMILVLAAVVALVAVAALALRRGGGAGAEVTGRLAQIAEAQAASQGQLAERLQAQERALTQHLAEFGDRVGSRLQEHSTLTAQSMGDLKERLAVLDAAQKNIVELSTQVVGLQDILANTRARGAFGEVQLENLVRDMLPANAYKFQETLPNGRRVDCLINLPHPPGPIALDAKFPLESYRALREASDKAQQTKAARDFTIAIKGHVEDIAERYILAGVTADCALMFLPSEAVYAELHGNFPNLVEDAQRRRVSIVSPSTLMFLLNTVRAVLRDVRLREQAGRIRAELQALLDNMRRLDDRVQKLQTHFGHASEDIRQIQISSEKVSRFAERLDQAQLEDAVEKPALIPGPS